MIIMTRKQKAECDLPDELRCTGSTNSTYKQWRCSKHRANNSTYCEKHHHQHERKNQKEAPQDELRCTKSSGNGWRCSKLRANDSTHCEHHRDASNANHQKQRNRYEERKKQIEGAQDHAIGATEQDELRCARADNRGWRCSKLRANDCRYCEHHRDLLQANNSKYCEPHHRSSQENNERKRKNREEGAQDVVIGIAKKRPSNSANPK